MALGAQHGARREGRVGLSQPSIPGAALDQIPASSPEPCTRAPHTQGLCQHPSAAESIFFPPNCTLRVVLEWFKWDKIPPSQYLASLWPPSPAGRGVPEILGGLEDVLSQKPLKCSSEQSGGALLGPELLQHLALVCADPAPSEPRTQNGS